MPDVAATSQSRWGVERGPGGWNLADAALALLCQVALAEEILLGSDMQPRGALLLTSAAMSVPIAWRRVFPGGTAAVAGLAYLATNLLSTGDFPPQFAIIPLLALLYGAASRTRGRRSAVWGAATLVMIVTAHIATPDGNPDDFWPWLLWGGAWTAGTFVRRRSDAAAHHAARAAVLEAEARTTAADSAQRERDRIARELHDVVAHAVSVMVVQAGAERLRLGAGAQRTGQVLAAIEDSGRQALSELRTMLGVLRDQPAPEDALAPLPGLADLPALVERLRGTGLAVDLVVAPDDAAGTLNLSTAVELAVYRIVQESLTNVVRHAGLVRTTIRMRRSAGALDLEVCNEPASSTPVPSGGPGAGRGIVGMRERAGAVGGSLTAGPGRGGGFRVHAVLPVVPLASGTAL